MKSNLFIADDHYDKICIMAPGPSLTASQVDMVMSTGEYFTIGVGNVWKMNPFTDLLYHCDRKWWEYHNGIPHFFGCQRISLEQTNIPNVKQVLQSPMQSGIDMKKPYVVSGRNSGYQALNIACHYNPRKIILIGYDMQRDPETQRYSIAGEHPPELHKADGFSRFIQEFEGAVKPLENLGIKIYNCTINTALTAFERRELKDVL